MSSVVFTSKTPNACVAPAADCGTRSVRNAVSKQKGLTVAFEGKLDLLLEIINASCVHLAAFPSVVAEHENALGVTEHRGCIL